jgi:hypothetical protein
MAAQLANPAADTVIINRTFPEGAGKQKNFKGLFLEGDSDEMCKDIAARCGWKVILQRNHYFQEQFDTILENRDKIIKQNEESKKLQE